MTGNSTLRKKQGNTLIAIHVEIERKAKAPRQGGLA